MMLTGLADVLRKAGCDVEEVAGWRGRGHGEMLDVRGVTCHHTANGGASGNAPSLLVVRDGRPGLDGPLAHLVLGRDGTFYVVAAGLCWHAGESRRADQTNGHRIGIEAEAKGVPGTKGDWPKAQMDAYARGCAALAGHYGFDLDEVLGHKETCSPAGRKSDPSFDMGAFRRRVRAVDLEDDVMQEKDWARLEKLLDERIDAALDAKTVPNRKQSWETTQLPNMSIRDALSNIEKDTDTPPASIQPAQ